MSGAISIAGLWSADKAVALTGYTSHRHDGSPIASLFSAPQRTLSLRFGPLALAAAVARTATTRDNAPIAVLEALQNSTLPMLEAMVDDGTTFGLSPDFQYLADTERVFLAARVGAGITDLYMNTLGYTWRANAACLTGALDPHADFIYDGGNASGHGVVLAEAHGTFAATANARSVHLQAKNKYLRQVKPHLAVTSPYGKVIHGYSVAFGSSPKTPGAFLSLSEPKPTRPKREKRFPPPQQPPFPRDQAPQTSIALATHRSNFFLMGSDQIVGWIDWAGSLDSRPPEPSAVAFLRIRYAGRPYLVHPSSFWWPGLEHERLEDFFEFRYYWHHRLRWTPGYRERRMLNLGWYAMDENAGVTFLSALTQIIREGGRSLPATLPLPSNVPAGFGADEGSVGEMREASDYQYALFRDGLALLGDPHRGRLLGALEWSPKEGVRLITDTSQ